MWGEGGRGHPSVRRRLADTRAQMPKRVRTSITSAATTPPRHRILNVLVKHKDKMPDQAYKEIAESISAELRDVRVAAGRFGVEVNGDVYKITFIEKYEINEAEGPMRFTDPVMKEVEMTLPNFFFSICDLDPGESEYHAFELAGIKNWHFPRAYVVDLLKGHVDKDDYIARKYVTLLSACKM